jgi:hypothetical protein
VKRGLVLVYGVLNWKVHISTKHKIIGGHDVQKVMGHNTSRISIHNPSIYNHLEVSMLFFKLYIDGI